MICQFCNECEAKYICPRCNINYCSVHCYQNQDHLQCTEQFYEGWVKACLESDPGDPTGKHKMLEILKRFQQEEMDSDDDDVSGEVPLEERIADIRLEGEVDPAILWSRLTDNEKREFQEMLEKGPEKLVPIWKPWWNKKRKPVLVEEVGSSKVVDDDQFPPICENIPSLLCLTKRSPSDTVKNDVVNVIFSYAYVARLYNGDHVDFPVEAAKVLLDVSPVLNENVTFHDVREAVQSSVQKLIKDNSGTLTSEESILSLTQDLLLILEGSTKNLSFEYALRALSDIKILFLNAKKGLTTGTKSGRAHRDDTDIMKKKLSLSVRRIEYYLSWTIQFGFELEELLPLINMEYTSMTENISSQLRAGKQVRPAAKASRPPLIEELPS